MKRLDKFTFYLPIFKNVWIKCSQNKNKNQGSGGWRDGLL